MQTTLRSSQEQHNLDMRNDILKAVAIYNCSDSLWRYRDRIPHDVKLWFSQKFHITVEQVEKIAKDWVDLPANQAEIQFQQNCAELNKLNREYHEELEDLDTGLGK